MFPGDVFHFGCDCARRGIKRCLRLSYRVPLRLQQFINLIDNLVSQPPNLFHILIMDRFHLANLIFGLPQFLLPSRRPAALFGVR